MAVRCELEIMKSNNFSRNRYCDAHKSEMMSSPEKFAELLRSGRISQNSLAFLWIFGLVGSWKSLNHLSHMVGNKWYRLDVAANLVVLRYRKLGTIPTFILSIVVEKSPQMMMHFASSQNLSKSSIRNLTRLQRRSISFVFFQVF